MATITPIQKRLDLKELEKQLGELVERRNYYEVMLRAVDLFSQKLEYEHENWFITQYEYIIRREGNDRHKQMVNESAARVDAELITVRQRIASIQGKP